MDRKNLVSLWFICMSMISCTDHSRKNGPESWQDKPFLQDYSIKNISQRESGQLLKAGSDRNGYIQVLSSKGLMRPKDGQFLFPGRLVYDVQDMQTSDKSVRGTIIYKEQFVYLDDKAVFSNAWAGSLYSRHSLPGAFLLEGGRDFSFLISDGQRLHLLLNSETLWEGNIPDPPAKEILYDEIYDRFWIRGNSSLSVFSPESKILTEVLTGETLTCIGLSGDTLVAGTSRGYFMVDRKSGKKTGTLHTRMPWNELTSVAEIDGNLWFGSLRGAMMLGRNGKFDYYASKRWIPSDTVIHISRGPDRSVLILTTSGLSKICFTEMTLYDKAMFFERQVRERHIRHGFNATLTSMTDGDITTGSLSDSDNDGLWTSMYLAAETFRFAVDHSDEALQNVKESLDAMERLYTISGLNSGFPSRSFIRRGYKYDDPPWRRAEDEEWDWKSTTSSDEAIGHIFAFGVVAELVSEPEIRKKAILLMDTLMSHILKNDLYLVDYDGKPTRWGRWNPEYVNSFPEMVGDRKLNSSNITGMLQTAWHFTKKEKYREAAILLMEEHGYLENLMRPVKSIGMAPAGSDGLSKLLSEEWNHSDDEMYFLGYWGLYRYALHDTLKAMYRKAILDHWEIERPEKDGLWNIMTAMVDPANFDRDEAIRYLQEYPLDLINWSVSNSHRKDIDFMPPNFRGQTIKEVLPPDELGISRHNANRFDLDNHGEGREEYSSGDIWLLPYWTGRYLGIISEPFAMKSDHIHF